MMNQIREEKADADSGYPEADLRAAFGNRQSDNQDKYSPEHVVNPQVYWDVIPFVKLPRRNSG